MLSGARMEHNVRVRDPAAPPFGHGRHGRNGEQPSDGFRVA